MPADESRVEHPDACEQDAGERHLEHRDLRLAVLEQDAADEQVRRRADEGAHAADDARVRQWDQQPRREQPRVAADARDHRHERHDDERVVDERGQHGGHDHDQEHDRALLTAGAGEDAVRERRRRAGPQEALADDVERRDGDDRGVRESGDTASSIVTSPGNVIARIKPMPITIMWAFSNASSNTAVTASANV